MLILQHKRQTKNNCPVCSTRANRCKDATGFLASLFCIMIRLRHSAAQSRVWTLPIVQCLPAATTSLTTTASGVVPLLGTKRACPLHHTSCTCTNHYVFRLARKSTLSSSSSSHTYTHSSKLSLNQRKGVWKRDWGRVSRGRALWNGIFGIWSAIRMWHGRLSSSRIDRMSVFGYCICEKATLAELLLHISHTHIHTIHHEKVHIKQDDTRNASSSKWCGLMYNVPILSDVSRRINCKSIYPRELTRCWF